MNHLVILHKPYLEQILTGTKAVESRLSKRRHPARHCQPGDTLYLKETGGDVRGRATARSVTVRRDLTPQDVESLKAEWSARVDGGPPDHPYWNARRDSRHAVFIELTDVRPCHIPKEALRRNLPWASAWILRQPPTELVEQYCPAVDRRPRSSA